MGTPLLAAAFALATAAVFGAFSLLARVGGAYANATTGVLIGLFTSIPLMLIGSVLFWDPSWWNPHALLFFILAGMAGPACSRVLLYLSIHRLGVARAMPLTSVMPLFSTTLAVLFLGEQPGPFIWAGTLLIVAGSASLSYKKPGDTSWERRSLWFIFLSVFVGSFSFLFRKIALTHVGAPIFGVTVSSLTGLVFLLAFTPFLPEDQRPRLRNRKAWGFYGACGLLNAVGFLTQFSALSLGDVSIVIPLSATAPFFALLLSAFLLRGVERLTPLIVAGTVLIVAGGALIGWRLR